MKAISGLVVVLMEFAVIIPIERLSMCLAEIASLETQLRRYYKLIDDGLQLEAVSKPIAEKHDLKSRLEKRLSLLEAERERAVKLPVVTDSMVNEVLECVKRVFSTDDPKELNQSISEYIERIKIEGNELKLFYTFCQSETISY
jgi:hypothetical protein